MTGKRKEKISISKHLGYAGNICRAETDQVPRNNNHNYLETGISFVPSTSDYTGEHKGLPIILQRLGALIALIVLLPVMALVALLLAVESKGGPIFRQVRVGKHGRLFQMYKFRTMYCRHDKHYPCFDQQKSDRPGICTKHFKDLRVTRIGRFVRKYSLDELPQLFNILSGDMLLIGPRPALQSEYLQYDEKAMGRLSCLPGLSCFWQISGRADIPFEQQVDMDIAYIKQQSIVVDIKILIATIPAVLSAKGSY